MNDFDAFPPTPLTLEIAEIVLAITPIRIGEIPALLAAVRPFAHRLVDGDPDWLWGESGDDWYLLFTGDVAIGRGPGDL